MAKSVKNEADRRELIARLDRLAPDTKPRWGRFNAPRMLAHVTDALGSATGTVVVTPKATPMRFWPINSLVMFHMPWPKSAPTAPELLSRVPETWDAELRRCKTALDAVASHPLQGPWPVHAVFGKLSGEQWMRLMHRHLDHHLTQFGV